MQQGFPAEAPAIQFQKGHDIFACGTNVVCEIVGDVDEQVQIIHDEHGTQFPELNQALREAYGEDNCFCVATCPSASMWAVGVGGGWKTRERAAKLALGLAFGCAHPENLTALGKWHPDFVEFCGNVMNGACGGCGSGKGGAVGGGAQRAAMWGAGGGGGAAPAIAAYGGATPPPVAYINLGTEVSCAAQGICGEAPVIVHAGKSNKDAFSSSHGILQELVDEVDDVVFYDDADWNELPEVGEAVRTCGLEPDMISSNGLCVAVHAGSACWGVSLATNKKFRESAAKLSLALAIAGGAGRLEEFAGKYPEFNSMCVAAGIIEGEPAAKKGRVA